MKYKIIKKAVCCNIFKILIVYTFLFSPFGANAQDVAPEHMVLTFYKKYMIACSQYIDKLHEDEVSARFCGMNIKKYITQPLFDKIIRSMRAEPIGDLMSPDDPNYLGDSDYFTHTQDYAAEWASLMSAKMIRESGDTAVVRLLINALKNQGGPDAMCVRVQRDRRSWKIYQVDLGTDNPLPDCQGKG